jgi:hypothetical protein
MPRYPTLLSIFLARQKLDGPKVADPAIDSVALVRRSERVPKLANIALGVQLSRRTFTHYNGSK